MKTSKSPELKKIRQNNESITSFLLQSKLESQDAKPLPLKQARFMKSQSFHQVGNAKEKNDKLPFLEFERKRELNFVTMYVKRKNIETKEQSNQINENNDHRANENNHFRKRDLSCDSIENGHFNNKKIHESLEKKEFYSAQIENKASNFSKNSTGVDNYKNPFNKTADYFNEYFPQSNRKSLDTKIFKAIISERKIDKNMDCVQSLEENKLKMQGFFNKTGLGPRQQIEEMKKWFENQENKIDREKESDYKEKFNKFFELYDSSLTELILQIKTEFNERGSFLYQIWNKFNKLNSGYKIFLKNNMDDFERKKSEQINLYLQKYNDIIQNRNGEIEKLKNTNAKLILERDALSKKVEDFSNDKKYHNEKIYELKNYCLKFQEKYNLMKRSYEKLHKRLMLRSDYYANFKNEEPFIDEKKQNWNKNNDNPEEMTSNNKIIKKKSKIIETNHESMQINTISADFCSNIQEEEKNINLDSHDNPSDIPSNPIVQESMKEAIKTESQNSKKSIQIDYEKNEKKIASLQKLPSAHDNLIESTKKNITDENLNNPLNNENHSVDSSEISEPEKVSEFEIASSQDSKNIIKLDDLNNLRRMVNPDKFQASYQDRSSQTEDDLNLKKEIETQTPTFLLDRKYDHVFLANSKINEYLQEYLHKKEVESMLSEYNLNEVNANEKTNKEIRKMVEETLENSNKVIEISHFLISNNENEHLQREQSEILEENSAVSKEQKEIFLPIMKGLINSATLKTKTMQKFREFLLKIMNFYLQESFKNKIFGEEISKLNAKINEIMIECDNVKQENESLNKKLDDLSPMIASQRLGDFQFEDLEGEDNGEMLMTESSHNRSPRKMARSFRNNNNNNMNGISEFEELKKKIYNPGPQLIAQIKGKNLNNFVNMISLKSVFKIILQIYQDRVVLTKENPKIKDIEFSTFVYNFFIKVYGFRKMAQQKFLLFSLTLRKYPTNFRINFFSKFLGLLDPPSANLSLENLNIYISVLESVLNSYQNLDGEQRYMVSATKLWDYFRASFESKGDSSNPEVLLLKKEFDAIKEDDPKNTIKFGIIDLDVMMSKYLVFLKTIRNKNKTCLNMVFSLADMNNDGLCDLNEFELIFKYFEAEQIKENCENPAAGIFESFANQVANNTKSLNFNQFCNICEENNVFDDDKIKQKLKLNDEEENNAKFNKICTEWINKKQQLLKKIEKVLALKNIKTCISWDSFIERIEVKIEKASKTNEYSEKIIATNLVSILENELDLFLGNEKKNSEYKINILN